MAINFVDAVSAAIPATATETVNIQIPQADLENLLGGHGSVQPYKVRLTGSGTAPATMLVKKVTWSTVSPDDQRLTVLNSAAGWTLAELQNYMADEEGMDAPRYAIEDGYKLELLVDNSGGGDGTEKIALKCKVQS